MNGYKGSASNLSESGMHTGLTKPPVTHRDKIIPMMNTDTPLIFWEVLVREKIRETPPKILNHAQIFFVIKNEIGKMVMVRPMGVQK